MKSSLTIEQMIEELTDLGEHMGYDQTVWIEDQKDDKYIHKIDFFELCSLGSENGVEIKTKRINIMGLK